MSLASRVAAVMVIIVMWLVASATVILFGLILSVDEEWQGWSDVLLNPYLMIPYILVIVILLAFLRIVLRKAHRD